MLTLIIIAVFILFGVPALLLLMARLLKTSGPRRSSGLVGFPIDSERPGRVDPPE
jgi:hypothetical protein